MLRWGRVVRHAQERRQLVWAVAGLQQWGGRVQDEGSLAAEHSPNRLQVLPGHIIAAKVCCWDPSLQRPSYAAGLVQMGMPVLWH